MTPQAALAELLARVGASHETAAVLSSHELNQWPGTAVAAMKAQRLLTKAKPAINAVCPGCERDCVMPVQTRIHPSRGAASFIVCDKRNDVSRVPVPVERLEQWRCTADAVCDFIAAALGLRGSGKRRLASADFLEIGRATGDKRNQMLSLRADGELALVAGNNALPLTDLIDYRSGEYSLNAEMTRQLVDSATTADNRHTPSNVKREASKLDTQAMYERWRKAYGALKKKHPKKPDAWCAQQIANTETANGRDAETIRKQMTK